MLGQYKYAVGENKYQPTAGLDATGVVDELATLLTSGRLAQEKRELLVSVYEGADGTPLEKSIHVQQLITTTPEFNTNGLSRNTDNIRPPPPQRSSNSTDYKALVHFFLYGGLDSFNVLVPYECPGATSAAGTALNEQYKSMRGEIGLTPGESNVRITANPDDGQPCTTFVIHPDVPILKELYDEGSLLFVANAGQVDSSLMTKKNYRKYARSSLFTHNSMRAVARNNDPFSEDPGTGCLGRLSEVLTDRGFSTSGISINHPSSALSTDSTSNTPAPYTVHQDGSTKFAPRPPAEASFPIEELSEQLNSQSDRYTNLYGEMWSQAYTSGTRRAIELAEVLGDTTLSHTWGDSSFHKPLAMISRLIQTRQTRNVDRDMFFTQSSNFDQHNNLKSNLSNLLTLLDGSLRDFVTELKAAGVWEQVVIVVTSEFGRTLTKNGAGGSDHGWGGHYFVLGGGVRGGHILGQYPSDITPGGPLVLDARGNLLPTTSWEAIWHGVHQWMGVETHEEMLQVLPNLPNAYGNGFTAPFTKEDMFQMTSK